MHEAVGTPTPLYISPFSPILVDMKTNFQQSLFLPVALLLFSCSESANQGDQSADQKTSQQIHDEAIVVDGHNDFLFFIVDEMVSTYTGNQFIDFGTDLTGTTHIDLTRQKKGGVDIQFFSVFCLGSQVDPYNMAIRQIDSMAAIVERHADQMALVTGSDEIQSAVGGGKSIAMLGVEGGHMIEDDLGKLETFYDRGVRYMTLTWNNSTTWATSSYDEQPEKNAARKGLNDFGRQVVARMNELGMLVDVSHVGEHTFWDVIETTTKPIIASHSSVYNICQSHRNLKDDQLKAIAENDGMVMVNFYPGYIDTLFWEKEISFFERHKEESDSLMVVFNDDWLVEYHLYRKYQEEADEMKPPLSKLIDHIDYITNLVGVDHVGLGSDFDGITIAPKQLDDVTDFPLITEALLEQGYSEADVKKILGENFLRVLRANESPQP